MEPKSVVVESSLPSGSPARVSQAESPTSQTNAAFDTNENMATEQVADISIVVESSTSLSPAHVIPQAESSTSSRNPPFDYGNMATEQEEDISIVVESSTLPSPAHVSQAESSTSNRNSPFEGMPADPPATEDVTLESSLPNLVHFTQCESSTSRANLETGRMPTEAAATEEITVETIPPNAIHFSQAAESSTALVFKTSLPITYEKVIFRNTGMLSEPAVTEVKNLPSLFPFTQAELSTSDTDSETGGMLPEPAVTEGITEDKNLTNLFPFADPELSSTSDIDLETDGKLLKKGKRKIGMPRGGEAAEDQISTDETSLPDPIPLHQDITDQDTSTSTKPIALSEATILAASRPNWAIEGKITESRRLCLAAIKGDWETAKSIMEKDRKLVRASLTRERDTVLHIAVTGKCLDFIRKLVDFMSWQDVLTANINNDTGLHIAAVSGMLEVANLIVEKNKKLLLWPGTDDLIPLAMAIQGGHREMVDFLLEGTDLDLLTEKEYIRLILDSLSSNLYDTALKLVNRNTTMAYERDQTGKTALHVLAQKAPKVTPVRYRLKNIREIFYSSSPYFSKSELAESADWEQVLSRILDLVMEIASEDITDLIRTPSSVIFDAAMSGNVQFLVVLLRRYPELLWEKDEIGRSVFHVAVVYRQENVFNLIYNTGAVKDYLVGIEDSYGNSMLHLAGMSTENKEKLGGMRANLLMQQEILWFKEVGKIARPGQEKKKNSRGMTPSEEFIAEHSQLLQGGEDTIKGTAKSCMLVATLIATVVFAAPLNVQGMNSPSKKLQSRIFALLNAAALCTSTSSIVMSLSILTSSYAQSDFLHSLHRRLIIALTTLFVSIATMVAAFGAAMFVIFDNYPLLFMFTIILFAGLPVLLFLMVHGDLFADLIRSYRWSKSLFKPSVHKIFV